MDYDYPPKRPSSCLNQFIFGCLGLVVVVLSILLGVLAFTLVRERQVANNPTPLVAVATSTSSAEALARLTPTTTTLPETTPLPSLTAEPEPTATKIPERAPVTFAGKTVPDTIRQFPVEAYHWENLGQIWALDLPNYDYYDAAVRYGDDVGERTISAEPYAIGSTRTYTVEGRLVTAELVTVTDNLYLWAERDYIFSSETMNRVASRLENELYPGLVELFGSEWRPGVDNDPHISILHLKHINDLDEIGFFNSVNQYPVTLDSASNEQEIVFLNMAELELGEALYYATIVHELQHLIQWHQDPNETVWLNEGMSQLAEITLGFLASETIDYLDAPHTQLNSWDYDNDVIYRHYAASYLFLTYFWEQLGDDAVRELARSADNGLSSVRRVLTDVIPGASLEDFLADWAVANLLDDTSIDIRYGYRSYRIGFPDKEARIRSLPYEQEHNLPQYGVHYIDIRPEGTYTMTFVGDTIAALLPTVPPNGGRVWLAPSGSDTNSTLTQRFDLRDVSAATLEITLWYELEATFDFAYIAVSTDEGNTWRALRSPHFSPGVYGPGWSGSSSDELNNEQGWLEDRITLNRFVGQEILVRIDVLNDGAFSERGVAISQISIPELDFVSTPAFNGAGWDNQGFAVVDSELPQQWELRLVQNNEVTEVLLDELNRAEVVVSADENGATLIVMPLTPWVTERAHYWLSVTE